VGGAGSIADDGQINGQTSVDLSGSKEMRQCQGLFADRAGGHLVLASDRRPGSLGWRHPVEVSYRLLAVPMLLWLISGLVLRGRWQVQVFWLLAVLSSPVEPVSQNLAAIMTRVSMYLMWHVVYGNFICQC
jgi:hypothetical protein